MESLRQDFAQLWWLPTFTVSMIHVILSAWMRQQCTWIVLRIVLFTWREKNGVYYDRRCDVCSIYVGRICRDGLIVTFKVKPERKVEKQLPDTVPDGVVACVQRKAWMDDRTIRIWYAQVYEPHISNCQGQSGLLLDDFIWHKSEYLKDKMEGDNSQLHLIPLHYVGLLQPCNVGTNKSLKGQFKHAASVRWHNRHAKLTPAENWNDRNVLIFLHGLRLYEMNFLLILCGIHLPAVAMYLKME